MLVITRRSSEKISFPQIGVKLHFIRVQGSAAKVGIDAPRDILIVRDEVSDDKEAAAKLNEQWLRLPKEVRHEIRNELHALGVGIHLLREQLKLGLQEESEETFAAIQEAIDKIDSNKILQRPVQGETRSLTGTVVLVEDNDNEREMLAGFLRLQGHNVVALRDGAEAIDYLATHEAPKVVLMDMRMPNCDGGSAVRKLRCDSRHASTRIFAISGSEPKDNSLEVGQGGVDRWFRKPLNPQFLLDAI